MTNHAMFSLYIMTGLLALAPVIVNGGNGELLGRVHVGDGD